MGFNSAFKGLKEPLFLKLEHSRQNFGKYSNIKFHEKPSSDSIVVPCRRV